MRQFRFPPLRANAAGTAGAIRRSRAPDPRVRFASRMKERSVQLTLQIVPRSTPPPPVEYRWDPDTDILVAALANTKGGDGLSGSVELQGRDGSWLNLDVSGGRIAGVEIAVWPNVRKVASLAPPPTIEEVSVKVPARASQPGIAALEVATAILAISDRAERTIHFRVGPSRESRTIRIARDVLLDIDERNRIAGIWLLNVPPLPDPGAPQP